MQVFGDIPMRSGKPLDHLVLCGAAFTQRRAARPNVGFGHLQTFGESKRMFAVGTRVTSRLLAAKTFFAAVFAKCSKFALLFSKNGYRFWSQARGIA
jgi:hypothetical protein